MSRAAFIVGLILAAMVALRPGPSGADPVDPTLDRPLANAADEAHARELMRGIRCVVCQSQSIDESEADIAAELRNIVREQIAAGHSDAEIEDYLTARYGDFVLLDPPFNTKTLILWLGPFGLAAVGAVAIVAILRGRRGAGAGHARQPVELTPAERDRLRQLLVEGDPGAGGPS